MAWWRPWKQSFREQNLQESEYGPGEPPQRTPEGLGARFPARVLWEALISIDPALITSRPTIGRRSSDARSGRGRGALPERPGLQGGGRGPGERAVGRPSSGQGGRGREGAVPGRGLPAGIRGR